MYKITWHAWTGKLSYKRIENMRQKITYELRNYDRLYNLVWVRVGNLKFKVEIIRSMKLSAKLDILLKMSKHGNYNLICTCLPSKLYLIMGIQRAGKRGIFTLLDFGNVLLTVLIILVFNDRPKWLWTYETIKMTFRT